MKGRGAREQSWIRGRTARLDWKGIRTQLSTLGYATTTPLLTPRECRSVVALYDDATRFRSVISMQRYRFGVGEYRYFAAPLPPLVAALRKYLYPQLAAVANQWKRALGSDEVFPPTLAGFLERCAAQGQTLPTPLVLRYFAGGYNCLHQDRYGKVAFPLQATILLSRAGTDFRGGEFLLVEQRPRMQSRGEAIALEQGQAVLFANAERPVEGARGHYRVQTRHGVSRIRSGSRYALGIIFHDAR